MVHACARTATRPVFNLTVADAAEYYANGVLVHNCDAMRYMVMHLDGGNPARIGFVSHSDTTPVLTPQQMLEQKPIDIEAETNRMLAGMFGGMN